MSSLLEGRSVAAATARQTTGEAGRGVTPYALQVSFPGQAARVRLAARPRRDRAAHAHTCRVSGLAARSAGERADGRTTTATHRVVPWRAGAPEHSSLTTIPAVSADGPRLPAARNRVPQTAALISP
jgi:hypothetical protein